MNPARDTQKKPLVEVHDLCVHFDIRESGWLGKRRTLRAVDGVDLSIAAGETLGLVGESGCGKTTAGRALIMLEKPTAGDILFNGEHVGLMSASRLRKMRSRIQIVFQDPLESLNPRMNVYDIIREPIDVHLHMNATQKRDRVAQLLNMVGLPTHVMQRYPHEFSGGQRQRIGIARALATEPRFVICDEPVSALDVSIQAQILNLLTELKGRLGLSYLFIAHNLAVVRNFADTVAVMYLGRIVEYGAIEQVYTNPVHPYTRSLLASVPSPDPHARKQMEVLPGEPPSAVEYPSGCAFHPRCPLTRQRARELDRSRRVTVLSGDERVEVVRECVEKRPCLETCGETTHTHACLLQQ